MTAAGHKAKSQPGRAMSAMPLKAALRTLHRTPSHYLATPPIPPAAAKPGPGAKARAGFERSLDLDDWRAAKGSLYSDVTYRVLITASREASYCSGSLARMETKGGRDGYPGCPLNGRRRRDSTRERYPLALVYFPAEAIERARRIIHPRSQHRNASCANVRHYRGRMLDQKIVSEIGQVLSRASIGISQASQP